MYVVYYDVAMSMYAGEARLTAEIPNATGSVAVQDSHRPVRPSTGSTAGGPTDADVDAHQETCSRECDTNRSSSNH